MSLLTVDGLGKSYFGRVVLDRVSLRVDDGERVALVGRNGSGKTTLLRIAMGLETPDEGSVVLAGGRIVGYLSQHQDPGGGREDTALRNPELQRIEADLRNLEARMAGGDPRILADYAALTARYEAMGGYDHAREMAAALQGLGLPADALDRPLDTLSGGERMRVALARLLVRKPDLLLLDEPTNHLDMAALEWLEEYLRRYRGGVLVVSHDRWFLDRVATAVAELEGGVLTVHAGDYSSFMAQKRIRTEFLEKETARLAREVEREKDVAQTMLSHRKMASYHSREKSVRKLSEQLEAARRAHRHAAGRETAPMRFHLLPPEDPGNPKKRLLSVQGLAFGFGARTLFRDVGFEMRAGDRVALCGPNGCGKSTLFSILMGQAEGMAGQVRIADWVDFAHIGQQIRFASEDTTVLDELLSRSDLAEGDARSLLARFGFRGSDIRKTLDVLSGGERARLSLCCLIEEKPDLLLLDEPTNHLDIESREYLEEALVEFNGAILAISHDRYFIRRCTRSVLGFMGREVRPFPDYETYREALRSAPTADAGPASASAAAMAAAPAPTAAAGTGLPSPASPSPGGTGGAGSGSAAGGAVRAAERRETALRREKIRSLEREIAALEAEKADLEADFATGAPPEAYHRYTDILRRIDEAMETYLELADQAIPSIQAI